MRQLFLGLLASTLAFSAAGACSSKGGFVGGCEDGQVFYRGQCLDNFTVAVNGEGYLPNRRKVATFLGSDPSYEVIDEATGRSVKEGSAEEMFSNDTQQNVWIADFSSVTDEGTYFVQTGDGQVSIPFKIGGDALDGVLDAAMLGMYGQRCGEEVHFEFEGETFQHRECHMAEANLVEITGETEFQDDTGGWHDAGDYGKYVRNGAFAVAFLLKAFEHYPETLEEREFEMPEKGGDTPDMLDEARVELEWILKTQLDDGSFPHKVTGASFEADIMPSADGQERYFYSTSTHSTGNAIAVLALAGRLYEDYDEDFARTCLNAALRGQDFLDEHPEEIHSNQPLQGGTGTYDSGYDKDERAWAVAELWETTGEAKYLEELEGYLLEPDEGNAEVRLDSEFDWGKTANLAIVTYLDSAREGRDEEILEAQRSALLTVSDLLAERIPRVPYGRATGSYYWGSNGVVTRMALMLGAAHRQAKSVGYLDAITAQIDYVLGHNGHARSYVTSLGANPPASPHHRPSIADGVKSPWPGLLIGGPNPQGVEPLPGQEIIPALEWTDTAGNYTTNEIAINWNTALIYALVAAEATKDDGDAECQPNCFGMPGMGGASSMGTDDSMGGAVGMAGGASE